MRALHRSILTAFVGAVACLVGTPVHAQKVSLPPVVRQSLPNGIRLILMEYHKSPTLDIVAMFPGGKSADPPGMGGVAEMVAAVMRSGTRKKSGLQFQEALDALGGDIDTDADDDYLTVSLHMLAKDSTKGLALLREVILYPELLNRDIDSAQTMETMILEQINDQPSAMADRVAQQLAFGNHPYGNYPTTSSLRLITESDLLAYTQNYLQPNQMILSVVGDFKTDDILPKLQEHFGSWSPASITEPRRAPVKKPSPQFVLIDKPDATQTQVQFSRLAYSRNSTEVYPGVLASLILGGSLASRLADEIRLNRSLTYAINSNFDPRREGGVFNVIASTKVSTTRELVDNVRKVLQTAQQGLTEPELQRVKKYAIGEFAQGIQSPEVLASSLASATFNRQPDDYLNTQIQRINAVTLEEVNTVAREYFNPDTLSVVLVGPAKTIMPQMKGLEGIQTRTVQSVSR